jgi:hypothetical protein
LRCFDYLRQVSTGVVVLHELRLDHGC